MDGIRAISGVNAGKQLTPDEQAEVAKMAARDREVRAHEAQHLAAAGSMAGSVEYTYEMGPDGKMYAVGGDVKIVITSGGTPEEALARARQLRAAADAPADPSGQDMSVAAKASAMEADALKKIAEKNAQPDHAATGVKPQVPFHGFDRTA